MQYASVFILPIIAFLILGDDLAYCSYRTLDHIVGRLFGGDVLEPYAGRGDYSRYDIIASARKLYKLVSYANDKGYEDYSEEHTG